MRLPALLFLLLCFCDNPRGIPIQIHLDTPEEHAVADPWIAELNRMAGCEWVFGPGKVWFNNGIEMTMDTDLIEDARDVDIDPYLVGYWDGEGIVMMDKEPGPGHPLDTEALIFLHELGHAVGFQHSEHKTSWMYKDVSHTMSPHDAAWQFISALGGTHSTWTVCDRVRAAMNEEN